MIENITSTIRNRLCLKLLLHFFSTYQYSINLNFITTLKTYPLLSKYNVKICIVQFSSFEPTLIWPNMRNVKRLESGLLVYIEGLIVTEVLFKVTRHLQAVRSSKIVDNFVFLYCNVQYMACSQRLT